MGPDLAGQHFGRWTVLSRGPLVSNSRLWHCRCDCGGERAVSTSNLRSGKSKSCGCLRVEDIRARLTRHGCSPDGRPSPEYISWAGAKKRCENPRTANYDRYGGRGISICPEWSRDFAAFLRDMGPRPSGTSLDRIDNDGPYAPGNCRWASPHEQARNKRSNHLITAGGETLCVRAWSERLGRAGTSLVSDRLASGWSPERAVLTPTRSAL